METILEVEQTPSTPEGAGDTEATAPEGTLVPAHLHAYRDFSRMRFPYPLCLHRVDGELQMGSLGALLDVVAASSGGEIDDAELLRRALLKLEADARESVGTDARLDAVWAEGVERILAETREDRRERLGALLEKAREALPAEAMLLGLSHTVAVRLMSEAAAEQRRALAATGDELQSLIVRGEQLLALDDATRKTDPAALETALASNANGEFDAAALSDLLGRVRLSDPLPSGRRERIARALTIIRWLVPVMRGEVPESGLWSNEVVSGVEEARNRAEKRLGVIRDFFAAVHTLALEVENRYREGQHDAFFGTYEPAPFERALCPPVLLHLDSAEMAPAERAGLLDLLGSDLPVKALVAVHRLYDDIRLRGAPWQASLGAMAVALHHPYVAQVAISEAENLWSVLSEGLAFGGPALFTVYTGEAVDAPDVHPFLRAAAAVEGRAFPVFSYAPSRSREPGERLSLEGNPQPELPWRLEAVSPGDGEASPELAFTFADFLACDPVLATHFEPLTDERRIEATVPLAEYLELSPEESRRRVPFILALGEDGAAVRLLVSNAAVEATRRAAIAWRGLQEAAGIKSVHALRAIEHERARLDDEKQRALDELRAAHEAALEQSTGEVAERIVSNLAARLLDLTEAPLEMPAPRPAAPKAPDTPSAPAVPEAASAVPEPVAPPADEDDDEPLALDEAYIETPRCTTCNECTNINGQMFAYDGNKQAYIVDVHKGTYREMVLSAEKCPVDIIHPGKPWNPDEPGLDELMKRAEPYL